MEYLRDTRLGLADIDPDARQRVIDLGVGDLDLGTYATADDLGPGNAGLDLLRCDLEGHADALQILPELSALHARRALDLGDPLA